MTTPKFYELTAKQSTSYCIDHNGASYLTDSFRDHITQAAKLFLEDLTVLIHAYQQQLTSSLIAEAFENICINADTIADTLYPQNPEEYHV